MNPEFTKKLGLWIYETKVCTQKINSSKLDIFGIIIVFAFLEDKEEKSRIFEKTFLLAEISMDIGLGMPFLTLSNLKFDFVDCHIH